jgi:hypothetical protein
MHPCNITRQHIVRSRLILCSDVNSKKCRMAGVLEVDYHCLRHFNRPLEVSETVSL